jgi:hypothetical protein
MSLFLFGRVGQDTHSLVRVELDIMLEGLYLEGGEGCWSGE